MKADKIEKYYTEWLNGLSYIEIAKTTKTAKSYAYKVLIRRLNFDKKKEIYRRFNPKITSIKDAPKFWNPEDEIRIPPCVGHEFEG